MAVDRKQIIANLSKLRVMGNQEGMIEAFGVLINQLPVSFWNGFAERITRNVKPELLPMVEGLLVNAAQECGYHTGYGIITSEEWKAVVSPMIESTEDVLHGALAVTAAFGWAQAEIVELVPGERMVIRAYDYYEADVVAYGSSSKKSAYMLTGVWAAFMGLAYGGDYPNGTHAFKCEQLSGIECGDDYAEFVVTKA